MQALRLSGLWMLVLLVSACTNNDPQTVSERYWEAVLAKDEAQIRQLVVSDAAPGLSEAIDPGPGSYVTFDHPERESYTGPGDQSRTARVPTTVHWADGEKSTTFETETVLVFEEGEWKVDPAATRQAFFDAVYRSALTGLEAALEESAQAFRQLGSELSSTMARELSAASRELQEQSQKASEELQKFLENLDKELQEELERHRSQ